MDLRPPGSSYHGSNGTGSAYVPVPGSSVVDYRQDAVPTLRVGGSSQTRSQPMVLRDPYGHVLGHARQLSGRSIGVLSAEDLAAGACSFSTLAWIRSESEAQPGASADRSYIGLTSPTIDCWAHGLEVWASAFTPWWPDGGVPTVPALQERYIAAKTAASNLDDFVTAAGVSDEPMTYLPSYYAELYRRFRQRGPR